jgi:hypothetical protein
LFADSPIVNAHPLLARFMPSAGSTYLLPALVEPKNWPE